jgi:hypothetical protein
LKYALDAGHILQYLLKYEKARRAGRLGGNGSG